MDPSNLGPCFTPQGPSAGSCPASPRRLVPPLLRLQPLSLLRLYPGGAAGHRPVPPANPQNSPPTDSSLGSTGPAVDRTGGSDDWGAGGALRPDQSWRNPRTFGVLLTECLRFPELASDAALAWEFLLFHFHSFLVPRTGPFLRSRNLICEELSGERLVLTQGTKLSPNEHASPLSRKSGMFLGCSVFSLLLKQVFDWATGIAVETNLDQLIQSQRHCAAAPAFSVTEISLCGDPQP